MTIDELAIATGMKTWTLRRMANKRGIMIQELEAELIKDIGVTVTAVTAVAEIADSGNNAKDRPSVPVVTRGLSTPSRVTLRVLNVPTANTCVLVCDGDRLCRVGTNKNFTPGMEIEAWSIPDGGYEYVGYLPRSRGRW